MRRALSEYRIGGIKTSLPFHVGLMDSPRFQWGQFDTKFMEGYAATWTQAQEEEARLAALVGAMLAHERGLRAIAISHGAEQGSASAWRRAALLSGIRA
jgi:acetyl-CoA carboxylase biotin carboxylase subunit